MKFLDKAQPLALVAMRLVLGIIMIAHGYPKVFGGLHRHVGLVSGLGLPGWLAYFSAIAEFAGGIFVLTGFVTRAAAVAICIDLAVAIARVHWKHGLAGNGGYEFPLATATLAFALTFFGAGPISLDWLFGGRRQSAGR